jgi:DUF4097 and DUF4098 domain-containing protein YvlB
MSNIIVNGVRYSGNSVTINNGKIIIDETTIPEDEKTVYISIEGNVTNLKVDACEIITVTGDVEHLETISGDVNCKAITGNVTTLSGDVKCSAVNGNVTSMSGDVKVTR